MADLSILNIALISTLILVLFSLGIAFIVQCRKTAKKVKRLEILEHETKISSILDSVKFPVWKRDKDREIEYGNLPYMQLIQESDTTELELFHDIALTTKAIDTGEIVTERIPLAVDGKRKVFEVTAIPCEDKTTIEYAYDISVFARVEHTLKNQQKVQTDILQTVNTAVAIYDTGKQLQFFNQAFSDLWGLDKELLDSNPKYSAVLEILRENNKLPEQANFQVFKKNQMALFNNLLEKEEDYLYLPDGRIVKVTIIPPENGGLLFLYEDLTEKITLERSYNTLMSVQKYTLDNLHEAIVVFGQNGRAKLTNPAYLELWGLDKEYCDNNPHISDILEKTKDLYKAKSWEKEKAGIISNSNSRSLLVERIELSNKKVLEVSYVPLPDGAMLLSYHDITDSAKVEASLRAEKESLQKADMLKNRFLENVSYELRSPLTSIIGFTEMLTKGYIGNVSSAQGEYLNSIYDSSKRLSMLIDNVLDVASIEAGKMSLEFDEVDVKEAIEDCVNFASRGITRHDLNLKLEIDSSAGKITADPKRLNQVIHNLLNNAISFTPDGGNITIGASEKDKDGVEIFVQDTGKGIPEEERDSVFEKFHKLESGNHTGTGLGLPLVKSFIDLHNGSISLESEIGKGTKISFYLPRLQKNK